MRIAVVSAIGALGVVLAFLAEPIHCGCPAKSCGMPCSDCCAPHSCSMGQNPGMMCCGR